MSFFTLLTAFITSGALLTAAAPLQGDVVEKRAASCFPALGFQMPSSTPSSLDGWWCDPKTEYAFLGFSYEVTACKSSLLCCQGCHTDYLQVNRCPS